MKYKFKDKFLFGGSMSAAQSDGTGNFLSARTSYDILFETKPGSFFNGVGPKDTSEFIKNYKSDIKLLSSIGIQALRHSFSWSKLFPNGESGKPNKEVVNYYHELFKEMKKNGIVPFMSLMHFELPEFIIVNGGIASKTFVNDFTNFAKFILEEFGNEVEYFAAWNEPFVQCNSMYLSNGELGMWPLEYDLEKYSQALNNVALSTAMINKIGKELGLGSKMGTVIDFNPGYARNPKNLKDIEALKNYTAFREESYLDPVLKGEQNKTFIKMLNELGIESKLSDNDLKIIKENKCQWLGVNYYTPMAIQEPNEVKNKTFDRFFRNWENPIMLMNKSRGWEIKPQCLYEISMRIKNDYGNLPFFITENGIAIENEFDYIAENQIEDDYRITFFKWHFEAIHNAIEEGANLNGYLMWTPIDSWSFMNAYKNRYGLISLDLATQKRTIKKSGYWWKSISDNRGF